jgi:hypothetical protein
MRHFAKSCGLRIGGCNGCAMPACSTRSATHALISPFVHRSRVYALIIDTATSEAAQAAAFWAAALGATARPVPSEEQFISLHQAIPGLVTAVQAVDDAPRFHLDIETDDVEAETARLLALGATQVSRWMECRVLRAPGGHLLCVLPMAGDKEMFEAEANTWP